MLDEVQSGQTMDFGNDDAQIYEGTVNSWHDHYGFIKHKKELVFVHHSSVQTSDSRAILRKGMSVKFTMGKSEESGKVQAFNVTCNDGTKISYHKQCGKNDTYDRKELFNGQIFSGVVKFFRKRQRYGFIGVEEQTLIQMINKKKEEGKTETKTGDDKNEPAIYFGPDDVECSSPYMENFSKDTKVHFVVYDSPKGLGAHKITDENGNHFQPQEETKKVVVEIDEDARFSGEVVKFVVHRYAFIKITDEDFQKKYPSLAKNHFYCEMSEVQSDQRPVLLSQGYEVTLSLKKGAKGEYRCANVCDKTGGKVQVSSTYQSLSERLERTLVLEDRRFNGTVDFFNHVQSWGKLKVDSTNLPEDISKELKGEASVYFHRDDLISSDKVSGLNSGDKVTFTFYKDEKGIGATDMKDENNEILSGYEPPVTTKKKNNNRGRRRGGWRGRGRGRGQKRRWNNKRKNNKKKIKTEATEAQV